MIQDSQVTDSMTILLVEDDPAHATLVKRSLEDHGVHEGLRHVADGEAALNYMFQRGDYAQSEQSPRPNVILLDLRLPRIDGLEVLRQIKHAPQLRSIPVVVLTTSEADRDIAQAYEYRANSYLVKPLEYQQFHLLMRELGVYWLSRNRYGGG